MDVRTHKHIRIATDDTFWTNGHVLYIKTCTIFARWFPTTSRRSIRLCTLLCTLWQSTVAFREIVRDSRSKTGLERNYHTNKHIVHTLPVSPYLPEDLPPSPPRPSC